MNEAWPTVKLGDVVEITSSKRIKMADYVDSGVPFYRSKEIIERSKGNNISTELFISENHFNAIDEKFGSPSYGDILLTSVGTLGVPYRVNLDDRFYFKDGNLTWFRNYKPNIDDKFLFCWLTSSIAKRKFDEVTIGSTQKALTIISLKSIEIVLPPLSEQKAIASVLGALDDKIENNRRMNETLEEMARAIFKSWFVDFDPVHAKAAGNAPAHMDAETAALFPNSFGDDGLPVGWDWRKIGECISFSKGRSYKSAELQDSDTALVTLKSFLRGGGYRPDGLKPYTGTYKDEQTLKSGDLIVALTDVTQAADVIGKPAIVRSNDQFTILVASLDVGVIRPVAASVSIPFLYCMMMTHDFQSHIYGHTSGTTVLHLSKEGLPNYEFGMPSEELLDAFTGLAKPIFTKIELNEATSKTLAELRDTLLPKLMSGEIRIKDAEREVEADT